MSDREFRATLSKGRTGWCTIFRHPVVESPDGRQKRRIRRGLGERDQAQALALVEQLNAILADRSMWTIAARPKAETLYAKQIVAAFYDPLEPERFDGWADRDAFVPLPTRDDGYATVQFVGGTGAGKTTVVRQLLGTDPKQERFPSISAAKTTIADMELVTADGPFRAVVSFLPRELVRQHVCDCVAAAVMSHMDGDGIGEIARKFLEHTEQHFRLSYLLGTLSEGRGGEDDSLEDLDDDKESELWDDGEVTDEEQQRLSDKLSEYLQRIKLLSNEVSAEVVEQLGDSPAKMNERDRIAYEELLERELVQHESFHQLVDAILDDIESRFELITLGDFRRGRDGWPLTWQAESTERKEFLSSVNRFSSNYAPNFGRLLTPLVEGIRVSGPFGPAWLESALPKLVLLDGKGIGHTADPSGSISTSITRRFQLADAIVLVDNAEQPMQTASCSALQSFAASGHEKKVVIAFTHFDEVKGANLRGVEARKNHVLGSLDNAVHAVGKVLGREAEASLKRLFPQRVVFLSNIQKVLGDGSLLTRKEFGRLLDLFHESITKPPPAKYRPVFDVANLVLAIQKATQEFHDRWRGVLSMGSKSGVAPEHWTRVKALTRRIGVFRGDEYDTLRPVADFIRVLQTHASVFLTAPRDWEPSPPPAEADEQRSQAIDAIKTEVWTRLHLLSRRRLIDERLSGWVEAYNLRGTGSTRERSRELVTLYESAAPVPNEMPGPDANEFLDVIRELVADAITAGGGRLHGWTRIPDEAYL